MLSMTSRRVDQKGATLIEVMVAITVIAIVVVSLFGLFISLVRSTIIAKRRAVAIGLATSQMEYLKSLPYDSLAVAGGSIPTTSPIPATITKTVNGVKYTITTGIGYADDAYDGCGSYPTTALKQAYCRNYPAPSGAPATDTNPADYKYINVVATDKNGTQLAVVDTQVSARVSETASTTGALFVTVTDPSGAPISGATVSVANSSLTPAVSVSDSTDSNGIAIFYSMPPDSNTNYVITATKTGYSSLSTIANSGTLVATYARQKILTQQSSFLTLKIGQMSTNSLIVETTDTNGTPLAGVKVYIKGGYKKYTLTSDKTYYYDNFSPTDTRPTTDASGLTTVQNLPPINSYFFCGDDGATNCKIGATTYYLVAAVPYGGDNSLYPIEIPETNSSTTIDYGGTAFQQKVRLMLTTNSVVPRVFTMTPNAISQAGGGLSSLNIVFAGQNLSGASAALVQGGTTFTGTGCTSAAQTLSCSFNLSAATQGQLQLRITNNGQTLVLPTTPLGGFNVQP